MTDDPHLFIYFSLLGLLVASAFFAAAEVAFVSLSPARVRLLRDEKSRISKIIVALKSHPQRFFVTISVWNNLVNIFAASFATAIALDIFGDAGLAIATGAMTFLILVFGEIFPKVFAQKHAEKFARTMAIPLYFFDRIVAPISWLMEKIFHLLGVKYSERMSEKEVVAAVELGTESGEIEKHEQELIQNVLEFTDTRVEEVMTPRVKIVALDKKTSAAAAEKTFLANTFSRLPVSDGSVDRIIGILNFRELFGWDGSPNSAIEKLKLIEPIFAPASRTTRSLFKEMQSRHNHLAIVVDEHGGTLGLVTLEDLLEEIVGEIEDEQDVAGEEIQKINSRTILVAGDTPLCELDKIFKTKFEKGRCDGKNLAFFLLEKFGKMPNQDAKIRVENVEFTIEKILDNRIKKVKIEKI